MIEFEVGRQVEGAKIHTGKILDYFLPIFILLLNCFILKRELTEDLKEKFDSKIHIITSFTNANTAIHAFVHFFREILCIFRHAIFFSLNTKETYLRKGNSHAQGVPLYKNNFFFFFNDLRQEFALSIKIL